MRNQLSSLTAAVLLAASVVLTGTARAQTNCNVPGRVPASAVYDCTKKANQDMNTAYQQLMKKLPASDQPTLRYSQDFWVGRRALDCWVAYGGPEHDGAGYYIDDVCFLKSTISRINFLNNRYRECLTSGCQPAKLKDPRS
ncbi:lysozyme inhibitor LprI family protein [Deinococcus sp.]|uniref:lysozyme inhibitor LprI family protein n=1 Tax=Deinococcus sp. TaxID=47478 RepID=UPI003C7BCBFC